PEHPSYHLAVHMETATEVGGDYYDFRSADDGTLISAVGDATGHGARAGTMVTIIKSLFSAAAPEASVGGFLGDAARAIQRMDLGRMNMALIVAELRGRRLTVASAGMPPPLLHRAGSGEVEEIAVEGMPLGTFASSYRERRVELEAGDTVLMMSDGFPELPDTSGEPLGYARVRELFGAAAGKSPAGIIDELAAAVSRWTEGGPPNDDVTFVVLRVR
ncbi:MAG: SpoIIE family protein phosphatase, partial [bacterium]|nr:SpoIIE family protein phosphatase [bacterium]